MPALVRISSPREMIGTIWPSSTFINSLFLLDLFDLPDLLDLLLLALALLAKGGV